MTDMTNSAEMHIGKAIFRGRYQDLVEIYLSLADRGAIERPPRIDSPVAALNPQATLGIGWSELPGAPTPRDLGESPAKLKEMIKAVPRKVVRQYLQENPKATPKRFVMKEIYGDKGYLSRDNMDLATAVGATPYIAFKVNSKGRAHGSPTWKRMFHLWQADPEGFDKHYHMRENVEAVFAAIKKKLGETLKSKNDTAQVNELLAKILAYNITVLIHEMYEHGVAPGFVPKARAEVPSSVVLGV